MDDLGARLLQHTPDKQTPVAAGRVFLPTEQSNPVRPHPVKQSSNRLLKGLRLRQPLVEDMVLGVVELLARRPAAQHVAEEQVLEPLLAKRPLDRLLVEVERVPRVGARPDIGHNLNTMLAEQVQQRLE